MMNAKIRTTGLMLAIVVVAAIGLGELRGQEVGRPALTGPGMDQMHSSFLSSVQEVMPYPMPKKQQLFQKIRNQRRLLSDSKKSDEEKAEARQAIAALLDEYFDEDLKARREKITEIEERVARLKVQIEKRRAAKSDLVQLQMRVIENEAAGLGFFGPGGETRKGRLELFPLPSGGAVPAHSGISIDGNTFDVAPRVAPRGRE